MPQIYLSQGKPCPYLTARKSGNLYILGADRSLYKELLERGWRRFGGFFFRPYCEGCKECVSVRIPVTDYKFSRSEKRVLKKCETLRMRISRPMLDPKHIALYETYHKERSASRGWGYRENDGNPSDYYDHFVDSSLDFGYEFSYYFGEKLVAVALSDILPIGVSAVYCYYDPAFKEYSLGTFSILRQIIFAQENNLPHLYLGYLVNDNASLRYKARFSPLEYMTNSPELLESAVWEKKES
ncbi:MAG: arginyltransferase [Helicobacteraceae bacterium]|jgi:arginine-tRNA-protein transferase|nr:arginyltransferase [Helicobacteraceae bacterium]